MKILFFLIVIMMSACAQKKEISQEKISFEAINREITPPPVLAEEEITLGEAATPIIDTGINRISNINLACKSINGMELATGEEFSFNHVTGKKTSARGYKYAPVIFQGEKSYGIGGGVCQVSTTIYMAAQHAKLLISERHSHSESVAYAPDNNDATVVYGEKDFRFKNTSGESIYVYTWVQEEKVYAKIVKKSIVVK